jgi:hypothetical protein
MGNQMDKKYYKTLLKLLELTSTAVALSNKLAELAVDSDDPKLVKIAKILSAQVRPAPHEKGTTKVRLLTLAPMLAAANTPVGKQFAANIEIAKKYCDHCLASTDPEWMVCARAAGWTPPTT